MNRQYSLLVGCLTFFPQSPGCFTETHGFWRTGEQFVVSTAATSPKVVALSARPDIALTIDGGDTPGGARALSVRGRAEVEVVDGAVPGYLATASKSMDAESATAQNCRKTYDRMARVAITERVRFHDFGAGGMPRFLQELAEPNPS